MIQYFRLFGLVLLLSAGAVTVGNAASFDCDKAATETEIDICAEPIQDIELLKKSYESIQKQLSKITLRKEACVSFEFEVIALNTVEWTLRELHNSQCGGDPSTAPRIAWLRTFADKVSNDPFLKIYGMSCGCYVMLPL